MSRRKQPGAGQSKPGRDTSGQDAAPTTGPFAHDPAKVTVPANPTRQAPQPETSENETVETASDVTGPMSDAALRDTPETPEPETPQGDVTPDRTAPGPGDAAQSGKASDTASETVTIRQGGFWSMLFGGALAASIGVVASPYILSSEMLEGRVPAFLAPQQEGADEAETQLAAQDERMTEIEAQLEAMSSDIQTAMNRPGPPPDLSDELANLTESLGSIESRLGEVANRIGSVESQLGETQSTVGDLGNRLTAVENRPVPTPDDSDVEPGVVENLRARVEQQRTDMEERQSQIDARLSDLSQQQSEDAARGEDITALREQLNAQADQIAALQQEAESEQAAARNRARADLQRAAVARATTALDTGSPFAKALNDLRDTGVEIPEPLSKVAETGASTQAELVESFPDAARAVLSRTRDTQDNPGSVDIGQFFREQLGMRSLTPREGDSPDAILSRAEAALRDGRIGDALDEIDSLPEDARSALDDWVARATQRQEALSAADELSGRLN